MRRGIASSSKYLAPPPEIVVGSTRDQHTILSVLQACESLQPRSIQRSERLTCKSSHACCTCYRFNIIVIGNSTTSCCCSYKVQSTLNSWRNKLPNSSLRGRVVVGALWSPTSRFPEEGCNTERFGSLDNPRFELFFFLFLLSRFRQNNCRNTAVQK